MAIDLLQLSTTVHDINGSEWNGPALTPTNPQYAYDGDLSTAFGTGHTYHGGGGDWGFSVILYSNHVFYEPCDISQISYKLYSWSISNGNYPNGYIKHYIDIRYDGAPDWTNLWSYTYGQTQILNAYTQNGNWYNVNAIRVRMEVVAGGDRDGWIGALIYDIRAIGEGSSSSCSYTYDNEPLIIYEREPGNPAVFHSYVVFDPTTNIQISAIVTSNNNRDTNTNNANISAPNTKEIISIDETIDINVAGKLGENNTYVIT